MWSQRSIALAVLFSAATLVPATPAAAQEPIDPVIDAAHQRVGRFLEQVSSGVLQSIPSAYQELLLGGPLSSRKSDLDELVRKTEKISETYGEYLTFERIFAKRVGSDLLFLKYLYKCEKLPVLWHVTFYRAPDRSDQSIESAGTWNVISIRFDTNLEMLTLLKE